MSDERDKWVFDVQIVGRGITKEQAWYDAKVNFCEDPVEPDKTTFVPFDPWHKWKKGGYFTLPEIRAHIRAIAARYKEFRAFRLILMDVDDQGMQSVQDIWQLTCLLSISRKYPYSGSLDKLVQSLVGNFLIIEELPISTWEPDH